MISQTARYALHILGFLAERPGELVRGSEIADATGVTVNYLSKILNQLRKSRVVDSQKGWYGGFSLREEALDRPIREVLAVLDGPASVDPSDCAYGLPSCDTEHPCPLHPHWEAIRERFTTMVCETRIRDLARSGGSDG
jgi:Rrf2 family protein